MATGLFQLRIDDNLRKEATEVYSNMTLDEINAEISAVRSGR